MGNCWSLLNGPPKATASASGARACSLQGKQSGGKDGHEVGESKDKQEPAGTSQNPPGQTGTHTGTSPASSLQLPCEKDFHEQ